VSLADASTERRRARSVTPPRTEREAAVHRVWSGLLGTDRFGVHENFFDLGGHSLLAVQVVRRLTRELQRACTLPMLFRYPSVAALAAALESSDSARAETVVALRAGAAGVPVFCISGVELYQSLADQLGEQSPVFGLFSQAEAAYWSAGEEGSTSAVISLASDYLSAVRARRPCGPYVLAGFSFGGVIAFEMAQQLAELKEEVALLVILDSDPPALVDAHRSAARLAAASLNSGARALLDLGRRLGELAHVSGSDVSEVRRRRYLDAMRQYRARPYAGRALFVESTEQRDYDPGHGWDALLENMAVHRLSARHADILRAPHVASWSREILALLASVRA
jgi:thioesterase domain-containing protein